MSRYRLVLNTLCQRRPKRLQRTLEFWTQQAGTHVILCPDRPTPEVAEVVDAWRAHPDVTVVRPSVPVLSPKHGQQWTQVRNECFQAFDDAGHTAEWSANFDDDWIMGPGWEVLDDLWTRPDVWSWRAVSLFVWDVHENVNVLQYHSSPLFGRYATGWRRDPKMTNQIMMPVEAAVKCRPAAEQYLPFYLLDYGTVTESERRFLFNACANAGKQDRYTTKYVEPPALMPLSEILTKWPAPHDFERWQLGFIRENDR